MYEKLRYIPSKISTMNVGKIGKTLLVNSASLVGKLRKPSDTFNIAYGGYITSGIADYMRKYYSSMPMAGGLDHLSLTMLMLK